ncbi:MAG: glycosyltransferase family 2 protein [Treponema sp.]|jgi:chlorobactene glucosyltransferase|nr:glycosyltransferase family 2 protein [Treponema sp.]
MLLFVTEIYSVITVAVGTFFLLLAIGNIIEMRWNTKKPTLTNGPMVSVLIPARNEEANIEKCILNLENQTYQNYEILVIDDNSTDNTFAILEKLSKQYSNLRIFKGQPLKKGWFGKPYALQQLSEEARGEILLLTDADTTHAPTSVSWAVSNLSELNVDMVSGYVGQELVTFGEKMTVPLMYMLTGFILPLALNRFRKTSVFSSAIGQYIAIKKDVFLKCGAYHAIRDKTTEDIYLARHIKKQGYKTRFLDISNQVSCRMYKGYMQGVDGIGKNIFDFFGKNTFLLAIVFFAVFFFLLFPFPILLSMIYENHPCLNQMILTNILFTLTWLVIFVDRKMNLLLAFLWPFLFMNLLFMAARSWVKTVSGQGFEWKGRVVT